MFSLNRVSLIGYQTQPVSIRQTPGGTSVTDLNLIVPTQFKTDSGEMLSGKSFHTVTVWGALAEVAGQFVRPGAQIYIGGRLQTDSWEDQESGEKRSKTKIVASEMILLDPKSGQLPEPQSAQHILGACNRADIIGNVTRDPEMRTTTSGQKVLTLGVATNDRWKDKSSGEMKEKSEFHNIVIWGDLAAEVAMHIRKGYRVFVSGRVQTRAWETQSGSKRTTTEIVADSCSLVGVQSSIAQSSLQSDSFQRGGKRMEETASVSAADAPPVPAVPEINYKSEISVEDLPF